MNEEVSIVLSLPVLFTNSVQMFFFVTKKIASKPRVETMNVIQKDVQNRLRKKKYNFSRSSGLINIWKKATQERIARCNTAKGDRNDEAKGVFPSLLFSYYILSQISRYL